MTNFLKTIEPGIIKVWHFMDHPGPFKEGTEITCTVCNVTFVGTMPAEEYDARHNSCHECGRPFE